MKNGLWTVSATMGATNALREFATYINESVLTSAEKRAKNRSKVDHFKPAIQRGDVELSILDSLGWLLEEGKREDTKFRASNPGTQHTTEWRHTVTETVADVITGRHSKVWSHNFKSELPRF